MDRDVTPKEFAQWQAYYSVDPFGDQREDMRFALLAMLVTAFGGKKKLLKDFMLFPEQESAQKQSNETMVAKLRMLGSWFKRGNNRAPQSDP